jgi:aminoglycoside 6'-N-acetyltransferase
MAPAYFFRPMTSDDLPLVRRWLETPEVVRWWGEPDQQYALVSGDLDHPDIDQFIVALDDHPFGYIQATRSAPGIRALARSRGGRAASINSSASQI